MMNHVSKKTKLLTCGTAILLGFCAVTGSLQYARNKIQSDTDARFTTNVATVSEAEHHEITDVTTDNLAEVETSEPPVTESPVTEPPATEPPATEPPATEANETIIAEYRFVLNTNSKKFHLPSCGSVKRMKKENTETSNESRERLIDMGYSPCKNCKP